VRYTYNESVDAHKLLEEHQSHSDLSPFVYRHLPTIYIKQDLQFEGIPQARLDKMWVFLCRNLLAVCAFSSDFEPFLHHSLIGSRVLTNFGKSPESFLIPTLLAQPSRGIRKYENPSAHQHGWDQLDQERKTPSPIVLNITRAVSDVEGNNNTCHDAELLKN
jgi:hypothetical protein